jgi:geranylgeranyl pyrophosphate synthase
MAFQIVDDILDETASTAQLGKPAGSDRKNAKSTYVSLHGIESARKESLRLYQAAVQELAGMSRGDWSWLAALAAHLNDRAT